MTGPQNAVPDRIGRYELLIPIGTGGMGTVYLARCEVLPGTRRYVAVKLMHPQLRTDDEVGRQLMHEAMLAASIQHPNVVSVLEAGESPHGVFLAMEHVEGDTLAGLIRAARKRGELLPLRVVGKIMRDALTGLHAAHELRDEQGRPRNLVHRDFSPQNILVGSDGISRLTDFGIAKALGQVGATATGIVKGKVAYMAPEQARGERIDRRSDVWAAGVVTWEALAARRLFSGKNDAATLLQVVLDERPPLASSVRRDVPPALDQAIAAALQSKPSRRLATAQALRSRIEDALADEGGVAADEEVAAYLRELVADKLERQRLQASEVLALRQQLAGVSASAEALVQNNEVSTLGPVNGPIDEFRDVSTRGALSAATRVSSRRRRLSVAALAGLGLGLAAAVWALREPAPTAANVGAIPALPSAPNELAPALVIEANEPIAQLELDDRSILLPQASREIEVPMPADGAWPQRLSAITKDGRKLVVALTRGEHRLRVEFPPPASRPRMPAPRAAKKKQEPDLADSPYGSP